LKLNDDGIKNGSVSVGSHGAGKVDYTGRGWENRTRHVHQKFFNTNFSPNQGSGQSIRPGISR